jgi:hypothetical protein
MYDEMKGGLSLQEHEIVTVKGSLAPLPAQRFSRLVEELPAVDRCRDTLTIEFQFGRCHCNSKRASQVYMLAFRAARELEQTDSPLAA